MLTADQLIRIFPDAINVAAWAPAIDAAWANFGFTTVNARAGFLGIIGNETGGLRQVKRENMNYSPEQAAKTFSRARDASGNPTETCRDRCSKGDEAFAKWIYAGIIDNGDEASGDGWKFRGGGIIQLTGRGNYRAAGKALGLDLESDPDLLTSDPKISAAGAAWFMARRANIIPELDGDGEADFLKGAGRVGGDAPATRATRLKFRRKALEVLGGVTLPPGDLKRDSKGDEVRALQRALMAAGHPLPKFGADGDFGEETHTALLAFQAAKGLPQSGIADAATRAALALK